MPQEIIQNNTPWEKIKVQKKYFKTGLYALKIIGEIPLCLSLRNQTTNQIVELIGSSDKLQYIHLNGAEYEVYISLGSRDFDFNLKNLVFYKVPLWQKTKLYFTKFFNLLNNGISPYNILKKIYNSLFLKKTFGINSENNIVTDDAIVNGYMCEHEYKKSYSKISNNEHYNTFKNKIILLKNSKEIDEKALGEIGLNFEINNLFATKFSDEIEFIFDIGENNTLCHDAFLQIIRALESFDNTKVIVFDKWINQIPTSFPNFDPLLFEEFGNQIPMLRSINYKIDFSLKWSDIEGDFKKFNAPIVFSNSQYEPIEKVDNIKELNASIIIPTRDNSELLENCINSINKTAGDKVEIIIVDNGSTEERTLNLFKEYKAQGIKILDANYEFNFSKLCNFGAQNANNEILIFVNNDIEFISYNWLQHIKNLILNPNIGAIGARLWYPDDTIQHCGIFLGVSDSCGHIFSNLKNSLIKTIPILNHTSLRSAVTGAFLAIEKEKYNEVGGFNEKDFKVTYNDVDICLKLMKGGYYNCVCNFIDAFHYESKSRINDYHHSQSKRYNKEKTTFVTNWKDIVNIDKWLPRNIEINTKQAKLK